VFLAEERFGHAVCGYFGCWDLFDFNYLILDQFSQPVLVDVHMSEFG
jgi:hypothetical protein